VAFIALVAITNTLFIVPQTGQALVVQLGGVARVINAPGLYAKLPFIQNLIMLDKRLLRSDLEQSRVISADQQQLEVDAYTRWQIRDPQKFYRTLQNETTADLRLRTLMSAALRRVLGAATSDDIISGRRAALMSLIRDQMTKEAADWGVVVLDVRIRQADYPAEVAAQVFERMKSERRQVAARLRAEGDQAAAEVRARADRDATVAVAEAREQSEKIKGEGDGRRAAIYAQAYNRDPEFAAFYRSMQAYEKAIPKGTPMVVPPQGEFFRYMQQGK
jgi:membrane protease subunit HflC